MKGMMFMIPLLYLGGNGYLFWRVWQAMSGLPLWGKIVVTLIFWVSAFSLFASIGLREAQMPEELSRMMFRIGAVWMVFLLYMVLLLAVFDIAGIFIPVLKPSLWYALPLTCGLLLYGYINYRHPKVEHLELSLENKSDGKGIRIAAISDIHLGHGTGVADLKKYVELINGQRPDLILIAGDLIDNSVKPLLRAPFAEVLSTLQAPLGIYMVPGNHEYISGMEASAEFLKKTPIRLLQDSIVALPGGIQLVGRDDRSNRRRKPLAELLESVDKERPVIVLDHQPYRLAEADSLGVDLQISGHTHHGQIWPFSLLTERLYEQSYGYRKWPHAHIWVSSGLSLWGPPFRIGTNSDMAVIELK